MCITRYSGGLHVEVMGDNLDVVTKPRIVATVKGEEDIQYEAVCCQHFLFSTDIIKVIAGKLFFN